MTTTTTNRKSARAKRPRPTASQRKKINEALEQHDRFRSSFFWSPPGNASGRRAMEQRESWAVSFTLAGIKYSYTSALDCSCKNVYYRGSFVVAGEKKTARAFRALADA